MTATSALVGRSPAPTRRGARNRRRAVAWRRREGLARPLELGELSPCPCHIYVRVIGCPWGAPYKLAVHEDRKAPLGRAEAIRGDDHGENVPRAQLRVFSVVPEASARRPRVSAITPLAANGITSRARLVVASGGEPITRARNSRVTRELRKRREGRPPSRIPPPLSGLASRGRKEANDLALRAFAFASPLLGAPVPHSWFGVRPLGC